MGRLFPQQFYLISLIIHCDTYHIFKEGMSLPSTKIFYHETLSYHLTDGYLYAVGSTHHFWDFSFPVSPRSAGICALLTCWRNCRAYLVGRYVYIGGHFLMTNQYVKFTGYLWRSCCSFLFLRSICLISSMQVIRICGNWQ
jgi:hypothetical protein